MCRKTGTEEEREEKVSRDFSLYARERSDKFNLCPVSAGFGSRQDRVLPPTLDITSLKFWSGINDLILILL